MKIGVCGTVSVGKSSLVKSLGELPQFKEYEIITERSKYLRDQGIKLNTDSTLKGQLVFAAERSLELMKENVITDRTVYDICAFTLSSKTITDSQKRDYTNLLLDLRNEYDVIIYVDPEGVEIEDNGVRTTDPIYRATLDNVIRLMLQQYPPTKLISVKGTTEQRIETILSELKL